MSSAGNCGLGSAIGVGFLPVTRLDAICLEICFAFSVSMPPTIAMMVFSETKYC